MNTQTNTTLMERKNFLLPDAVEDCGFSQEELADDMEGLQLGFQRVKIPSGGMLQFELPGDDPDNPEYVRHLEGVIVYSHNSNAYWPKGGGQDDNEPPACQSMDGKLGYGTPGGICASCHYNCYGTDPKGGKGKACKNMRVVYLLQSGATMPIQLTLAPTSIRPYTDFVNAAFLSRRRGVCSGLVRIGLKKKNNGREDYSVATFQKLYDFTGEELAHVRAYTDGFKAQIREILAQRAADVEAEASTDIEIGSPARSMPENGDHFAVGTAGGIDGDRDELPL